MSGIKDTHINSKKAASAHGGHSSTPSGRKILLNLTFHLFLLKVLMIYPISSGQLKEKKLGKKLQAVGKTKKLADYEHDETEIKKKKDWVTCDDIARKVDALKDLADLAIKIYQVQKALRDFKNVIGYYISNTQYLLIL